MNAWGIFRFSLSPDAPDATGYVSNQAASKKQVIRPFLFMIDSAMIGHVEKYSQTVMLPF